MNYEKTEITVIRKYFSDLLSIMGKQTRTFNVPNFFFLIYYFFKNIFLSIYYNNDDNNKDAC